MPFFSIILPTFRRNESGRLARAIKSVLTQTQSDFELFIVDDGSTDGLVDTIKSFQNDPRVKHIRFEKNIGLPALTCVSAFLQSAGDFIAWMFDDCEWDVTYLAEMRTLIDANPTTSIAYAQCAAHYHSDVKIIGKQLDKQAMFAGNNHIANCATIVRRSLYSNLGWVDPRIILVRKNDWDFLRRAITANINFAYLPKVLTLEYGVNLSDSLGNTYDANSELVLGFSAINRNSELRPDKIANICPISLPSDVSFSDDLLTEYLRLLIEFAILGWRKDLFERIAESAIFAHLAISLENSSDQIRWWASSTNKRRLNELIEKDLFIYKQQTYIDEQQKYINQQNILIQKKFGKQPVSNNVIRTVLRGIGLLK